jgi:DNA-binding MurR/RpiR family transcriptional regulator
MHPGSRFSRDSVNIFSFDAILLQEFPRRVRGSQRVDVMATPKVTHEERIRAAFGTLTRTERQLASHILRSYPVAALGSITALARAAGVSTPTVVRLCQKIGFTGYPDFQRGLREEVEERLVSPLVKHDRWASHAPQTHILNAFADAVVTNLQATLGSIDPADFDAVAALMADPARRIFALGGRITHALADYFITHMKVIRPDAQLIAETSSTWQPALLDIRQGDVLLVFDIRRYENNVLQMVEVAVEQGAEVVLVTDQWVSPAAELARHRFSAHVEAPSAWDSTVTILLLVETLIAAVQTLTWAETQARMKRMETLYDRTRFFRRK